MPVTRFRIETDATPRIVAERLRAAVRAEPGFFESFRKRWRSRSSGGPPFVGSVANDSFRLRKDIRGRNSFVPLVRGHITSTDHGTRVSGVMILHPLVAAFAAFWLTVVGYSAFTERSAPPIVMLIFGLSMTIGGFFFEASSTKRLLTAAMLRASGGQSHRSDTVSAIPPAL